MFRALYYPYSRCINLNTLKRCILLFDELWFADPLDEATRKELHLTHDVLRNASSDFNAIFADWQGIKDIYSKLIDKGIVKVYKPTELNEKNDAVLTSATCSDLLDTSFLRICIRNNPFFFWRVHRKRIPPSLLDSLTRIKDHAESATTDAFTSLGYHNIREVNDYGVTLFRPMDAVNLIPQKEIWQRRAGNRSDQIWEGIWETSFALGSSLSMNQALLVSTEHNLVPLTDSTPHHNMMVAKFRRACQDSGNVVEDTVRVPTEGMITTETIDQQQKYQLLLWNIMNTVIPDAGLENLSVDQVLKYRKRSRSTLQRFRIETGVFLTKIQSEFWDEKFLREISGIIRGEVLPKLQLYQDQLQESYEKLFVTVLSKVSEKLVLAIPTIIASFLGNLSPGQILALNGATAAAIVGMSLPAALNAWLEQRKLQRHGLTYLLELGRRTRLDRVLEERDGLLRGRPDLPMNR